MLMTKQHSVYQTPKDVMDAHNNGFLLLCRSDFDGAIEVFEKILQNSPQNSTIANDAEDHIGECLIQKGDVNQAANIYENLLHSNPLEYIFAAKCAYSYGLLGHAGLALQFCEKAIKSNADTQSILTYILPTYLKFDAHDEAIKIATNALRQSPLNLNLHEHVALAYMMNQEYAKALPFIKKVTTHSDTDFNIWYMLAICLTALNAESWKIKQCINNAKIRIPKEITRHGDWLEHVIKDMDILSTPEITDKILSMKIK